MRRSVILLVAALTLVTACSSSSGGPTRRPSLQERWWNWAAKQGENLNPVADQTGAHCAQDQPSDLWFLAGTFGGTIKRTCTVPLGRPVVAPLINFFGGRDDCADFMATAKGTAKLDRRALSAETMVAEQITVRGGAGNVVTGSTDIEHPYACGLWVRVDPLPAGQHTLEIRGSSGEFSTGVDYTLNVR